MRERVFLDSSVIIAFFSGNKEAVNLIDKLQDYELCICDIVFSEVVYKLMVLKYLENKEKFEFHKFKREISEFLQLYDIVLEFIKDAKITILPITLDIVIESIEIGKKYKLLPNDALIVSLCKHYGIRKIATFDKDFERVEFLEIDK